MCDCLQNFFCTALTVLLIVVVTLGLHMQSENTQHSIIELCYLTCQIKSLNSVIWRVSFWHAKTQTAFPSYVMKLIAVTLLLCISGRATCVLVLDPSAKANITHDRDRLIVKGKEFHYLGVNGFRLWVVSLKCSYSFKWLLDVLTARSTQQTLWARLGMLCWTYCATFYVASLRHII